MRDAGRAASKRRGTTTKPERAAARQDEQNPGIARVDVGLGVLWVAVPAVQYAGSYVRAGVQLDVASGRRTDLDLQGVDSFALLDLTPLYAILLAATVARVAVSWVRRSPKVA